MHLVFVLDAFAIFNSQFYFTFLPYLVLHVQFPGTVPWVLLHDDFQLQIRVQISRRAHPYLTQLSIQTGHSRVKVLRSQLDCCCACFYIHCFLLLS